MFLFVLPRWSMFSAAPRECSDTRTPAQASVFIFTVIPLCRASWRQANRNVFLSPLKSNSVQLTPALASFN